jgi:branched-subunit amino acid transport protein
VTTIWLAVFIAGAINVVTKVLGPVALGGRTLPVPARAVIALLAPALLAALVVVEVAGPHWADLDWTVPAGLLVAVLARLLFRAPDLVAILVGVAVTALLRLLT